MVGKAFWRRKKQDEPVAGASTPQGVAWKGVKRMAEKSLKQPGKVKRRKTLYQAPRVKCSFCPVRVFKRNMTDHVNAFHKARERFQCEQCNKSYTTKASLNQHKKTIHSGTTETNFMCLPCDKKFSSQTNLTRHLMTSLAHKQGRKLFWKVCAKCNSSFRKSSAYENHKCTKDKAYRYRTDMSLNVVPEFYWTVKISKLNTGNVKIRAESDHPESSRIVFLYSGLKKKGKVVNFKEETGVPNKLYSNRLGQWLLMEHVLEGLKTDYIDIEITDIYLRDLCCKNKKILFLPWEARNDSGAIQNDAYYTSGEVPYCKTVVSLRRNKDGEHVYILAFEVNEGETAIKVYFFDSLSETWDDVEEFDDGRPFPYMKQKCADARRVLRFLKLNNRKFTFSSAKVPQQILGGATNDECNSFCILFAEAILNNTSLENAISNIYKPSLKTLLDYRIKLCINIFKKSKHEQAKKVFHAIEQFKMDEKL